MIMKLDSVGLWRWQQAITATFLLPLCLIKRYVYNPNFGYARVLVKTHSFSVPSITGANVGHVSWSKCAVPS